MDWYEELGSDLWAFPRGMQRDGGIGDGSVEWVSKYASVTLSGYDIATIDGLNEKGLVANLLYLSEADFGEVNGRPMLSIGALPQYALDNFATVAEAVEAMGDDSIAIVATNLPNGSPPGLHMSLSDATGDSAIFEYIDGKLTIHHSPDYRVMTNSPPYNQQLALAAYWDQVGGSAMLPGTSRAADRFVRISYYLGAAPKFDDLRESTGAALSIIRNASVPLGVNDPEKPNIASTFWRSMADHTRGLYYFDSALSPNVFWVDINKLELSEGSPPLKMDLKSHPILAGDASDGFAPAEPFKWLAPE